MPLVIVRLPRGHAGRKRQDRLRAIQSLYLAFLVLLQIAECRREALISHSETYAATPKIEWMN